jgi:hypothetical protein
VDVNIEGEHVRMGPTRAQVISALVSGGVDADVARDETEAEFARMGWLERADYMGDVGDSLYVVVDAIRATIDAEAEAEARENVRTWLLAYAWMGNAEQDARRVECILSQEDWRHVELVAEQYAGAQFEPGLKAYAEGTAFALSALYECHDGPHLDTCPIGQWEREA